MFRWTPLRSGRSEGIRLQWCFAEVGGREGGREGRRDGGKEALCASEYDCLSNSCLVVDNNKWSVHC